MRLHPCGMSCLQPCLYKTLELDTPEAVGEVAVHAFDMPNRMLQNSQATGATVYIQIHYRKMQNQAFWTNRNDQ